MNEEFLMLDIWKHVIKKWWMILLAGVLCGVITFCANYLLVEPTYQASFTAYVNNSNQTVLTDSLTTADINASRNLTSTYATIITSQPNVESALLEGGIQTSYDEVKDGIQVATVNDTEIIEVSVVTKDPERSYQIASSLQAVSPKYVASIVSGSSMIVIAPAKYPTLIYGPNYLKRSLLGGAIGIVLLVVFLFMKELFDTRVKTMDALSQYEYVVLGVIHDLSSPHGRGGYYGYEKEK